MKRTACSSERARTVSSICGPDWSGMRRSHTIASYSRTLSWASASTARDALAQLSVREYEAIVCDLRMPDQSGPQIDETVRARSEEQAVRFIFTTGGSYGTHDDAVHEHAGATGRPVLE